MAWEVTRTVRVRFDIPDDRKSDLHATNDLFQYCANRTSEWAWRYPAEDCVTSKSDAEEALYDDYSFSTSTAHYDSEADEFYLHAVMERELDVASPEKAEDSNVLGVDCNVNDHIAVTSTGTFIGNANYLNHQRREFEKRRASLQQTGTRSARLTYQRIGDRFGRWSEDYLHQCSKAIVEEARRNECTHIAFENLERIRERISDGKKFQQWAFNALQTKVEYKAEEYGIVVDTVNPQYTSQQCSKCGCTLEENQDDQHFECLDCGFTANADYNAAKNVALTSRSNSSGGRSPLLEGRSVSTP